MAVVKRGHLALAVIRRCFDATMQLPANDSQLKIKIEPDRRDANQPADRALGRVIACAGSRATIVASVSGAAPGAQDGCAVGAHDVVRCALSISNYLSAKLLLRCGNSSTRSEEK